MKRTKLLEVETGGPMGTQIASKALDSNFWNLARTQLKRPLSDKEHQELNKKSELLRSIGIRDVNKLKARGKTSGILLKLEEKLFIRSKIIRP